MFSLLEAKGVAAVLLTGGSLFAGLLPKWLGLAERIEHSLFLSIILCFGAGVLLSTSLLHILHDTITELPVWGEVFFCAGFMALYFVDELVQFFCLVTVNPEKLPSEVHSHHHFAEPSEADSLLGGSSDHSKYGSIKNAAQRDDESSPNGSQSQQVKFEKDPEDGKGSEKVENTERQGPKLESRESMCQSFTNPTVKATDKTVKKLGLVIALSIHSILEGLAVGTQATSSKVIVLLVAVSCHKLVITFCLGAELISDGTSFAALIGSLSIYAISSGGGVLIGIIMNNANTAVIPLLQGLAGGSLLYITVGEILPRERCHKSHCNMPKTTGLIQFLSVLLGVIPIAVMNMYLDNDDY